jgi:hypothetical protein
MQQSRIGVPVSAWLGQRHGATRLPTSRGRQCDRTRSLPANSRKREYRNCRPETFGNLAAPGVDFATQRLSQMYESPPNAGLSRLIGRSRRMSGLVGWSERIRTHAFPIEPGLCVSLLKFGNILVCDRAPEAFQATKTMR